MVSAQNRYVIYNKDPNKKKDLERFGGVGVGIKPIMRAGIPYYYVKTRHKKQYFPIKSYGLLVIPAGQTKPSNKKVFNIKKKNVNNMARRKKYGSGTGKVKMIKVKSTPKASILAKAKAKRPTTVAQMQRERRLISKKPPTRTINMHGSKYTLYDEKARTKTEASKVRLKLKGQGKSAFINPRKRKAGTQWFIYQKPSEHAKARTRKPSQLKVSKRTGVPTKTINMHGKNYGLYDEKPRNKTDAGKLRKKLVNQGFSAFLNPRRRKSGIEYFVYKKKAERRVSAISKKKSVPRKSSSKRTTITSLEAELRALKARD